MPADLFKKGEAAQKEALEGVGVSVGGKTSCERLLELLEKHVIKKKTKHVSNCTVVSSNPHQRHGQQTAKGTQYPIGASACEDKTLSTVVESSPNPRAPEFDSSPISSYRRWCKGLAWILMAWPEMNF